MSTVAVVQARMGSVRLPGKSLMKLSRYTLLETVVRSVERNNFIDDIIIATSNLPIDDVIETATYSLNVKCYRGDPLDVLSRFVSIAKTLKSKDTIVRVTADNPINNHEASKTLYNRHINEGYDYSCIEGLSHIVYEFLKADILLDIEKNGNLNENDREHVTKYIRERPETYKVLTANPNDFNLNPKIDKLLTVDNKDDFLRFKKLKEKIDIDERINMAMLYKIIGNQI